jgi:hypothetical protein
MEIATRTAAAEPDAENLDYIRAGTGWVVLLDGVTPRPGLPTGCTHGTGWYVRTLGDALAEILDIEVDTPVEEVVADAIGAAVRAHEDECDVKHADHPQAMVGIVRKHGGRFDYYLLGDVTLVITVDGATRALTDSRPGALALFTPAAVRERRNQAGGFWVAAANLDAAEHGVYASVPSRLVSRAALLTDGATRLVDRHHHLDHVQLIDMIEFAGLNEVLARTRAAEAAETPVELDRRRGKRRDDFGAAFMTVHPLDENSSVEAVAERLADLTARLPLASDLPVVAGMLTQLAGTHALLRRVSNDDHNTPNEDSQHPLELVATALRADRAGIPKTV